MLLRVETVRACARAGPSFVREALAALELITLLPVDDQVLDAAEHVKPLILRSLDALHLATALSLGRDLGVVIAYDRRLCDAAAKLGVAVRSPA